MVAIPFDLSGPIGHRAALGLLVLQTDETIEHDMRRVLPVDGVSLNVARVPNAAGITAESLAAMKDALPKAAGRLPRAAQYDVIGYGCTSASSVIGPDAVAKLIGSGARTAHVTEPVSALVAACAALGVGRLAFLSPYIEEVSATLRGALAARGVDSPVFGSFEEGDDARVARIAPESIAAGALALGAAPEAEAVFLSCTNLRTLDVIDRIEAELGKPVLSSNQVLAWHMARLAGLPGLAQPVGRLCAAG